MLMHKVSTFLSEISIFFRENDSHKAMYTIMDVIKGLKMTELSLFGTKSKCNHVYTLLQVFHTLLLYLLFIRINNYWG